MIDSVENDDLVDYSVHEVKLVALFLTVVKNINRFWNFFHFCFFVDFLYSGIKDSSHIFSNGV